MAKGEKRWSTEGKAATKTVRTPLASGTYELKLHTQKAEIGRKQEDGKTPYIKNIMLEALGTAASDEGKNRVLFTMFFTGLVPGKDGTVMPARANQINGLAKAMGEEYNGNVLEMPTESGGPVDYLDAKEMLAWLKERDGVVVKGHTKIEKGKDGYEDKAVVDYFEEGSSIGTYQEETEDEVAAEEEEDPEFTAPKKTAKRTVARV